MFGPLSNTIHGVVDSTWPMIIISIVVLVSFRFAYIIKNHEHICLYKELLMLSFIIYILCLFQVVTFQDDTSWSSNNFIPFKEILRYNMGSRLFFKNVIGNMIMFVPFGFFISYYLKNDKVYLTLALTVIASIAIETVQMIIGRVFDVDDILLNVVGGCLGFLCYFVLTKIGDRLPFIKKDWVLNVISILVLICIITLL